MEKECVHDPWTVDTLVLATMKSQDIFLLMKLVSIADSIERVPSPFVEDLSWKDWDTDNRPITLATRGISSPLRLGQATTDVSGLDFNAADEERAHADALKILADASVPEISGAPESTSSTSRTSPAEVFSVRSLAETTGIGKSEISNILRRCYESGLARPPRGNAGPSVNRAALADFLIYGVRYVFPVKPLNMTRGIATGVNAPVFAGALRAAGETGPVWPDPKGSTMGASIEPLYKTVPFAVRTDPQLYAMLALVDSLRIGLPRERQQAAKLITDILGR